jgi:putative DNA primase/helicase
MNNIIDIDTKKQEQHASDVQKYIKETGAYGDNQDLFPVHLMSDGIIKNTIIEVQRNTQAPMGLVGSAVLAYSSLAIHHGYNVRVENEFECPTSLWVMTLAQSGERKSGVSKLLEAPFDEFDAKEYEVYKEEKKKWFARHKQWEAEGHELSKPKGKAGSDDRKVQWNEIENHALEEPEPPRRKRYVYNDVTSERLLRNLGEQWPSAGLMLDEGGTMLGGHSMGKSSFMGSQSNYNSLWGSKAINISRQSNEAEIYVKGARLVIYLAVQEEVFRKFIKDTEGISEAGGFIARFLVNRPPSMIGQRVYGLQKKHKWVEIFKSMALGMLNKTASWQEKKTLKLSAEAHVTAIDFMQSIEDEQKKGGALEDARAVSSKIGEQMARIAATLHVANNPEKDSMVIEENTVAQAIALTRYYMSEASAIHGDMAGDITKGEERALLDRAIAIARKEGTDCIRRTTLLKNAAPARLQKEAFFAPVLSRLEESGCLDVKTVGRCRYVKIPEHLIFGKGKN